MNALPSLNLPPLAVRMQTTLDTYRAMPGDKSDLHFMALGYLMAASGIVNDCHSLRLIQNEQCLEDLENAYSTIRTDLSRVLGIPE